LDTLLKVDHAAWSAEVDRIAQHYARYGERLPGALKDQLIALRARVAAPLAYETASSGGGLSIDS
jgi:phosphoenolpyruvate carboxykinase (GTP)